MSHHEGSPAVSQTNVGRDKDFLLIAIIYEVVVGQMGMDLILIYDRSSSLNMSKNLRTPFTISIRLTGITRVALGQRIDTPKDLTCL
jgi:hypothetical protein